MVRFNPLMRKEEDMPVFTLTALEVSSIQRYIFGSNRLQENIGASELVHRATHQLAFEQLPELNNVTPGEKLDTTRRIEDGELACEVVYAGGGNTLILFASQEEAKAFVGRLSKRLIAEAPGLELVAAHVPVNWAEEPLGNPETGRIRAVMDELSKVKRGRFASAPILGMGVTAACQSTGLAAVEPHPQEGYPMSAEVSAKLGWTDAANERLINFLPQIKAHGFEVPLQFDDFGRSKGEISYIAVVHADGNGMGQRVRHVAKEHDQPGDGNRAYIKAMREFSIGLEDASQSALRETVDSLLASVSEKREIAGGTVPMRGRWLPFRPLVFGGDDVTFVCDGRLGLALAARYLRAFEDETRKAGMAAFACGGVGVVKTHYPFARAYQLAEELCGAAKNLVRQEEDGKASALDWHFATSGLLGGLADIRRREYELPGGARLYMRPVRLRPAKNKWRTWDNFSQVTAAFHTDEKWAGKRNKVIRLRQALRGKESRVEQFRVMYSLDSLPEMAEQPAGLNTGGWDGHVCGYFDPIEAMDFYVPLDGGKEGN
jgi:hypothetical protein